MNLASTLTPGKAELKKANEALSRLTRNTYFDSIPLSDIIEILDAHGFDSGDLDGIYTGHEGQARSRVSEKHWMMMTWYRMPSGRFEIVAYIN